MTDEIDTPTVHMEGYQMPLPGIAEEKPLVTIERRDRDGMYDATTKGYNRLARAVIVDAILDATKRKVTERTRTEARNWLLSQDCEHLCELLDYEYELLEKFVRTGEKLPRHDSQKLVEKRYPPSMSFHMGEARKSVLEPSESHMRPFSQPVHDKKKQEDKAPHQYTNT